MPFCIAVSLNKFPQPRELAQDPFHYLVLEIEEIYTDITATRLSKSNKSSQPAPEFNLLNLQNLNLSSFDSYKEVSKYLFDDLEEKESCRFQKVLSDFCLRVYKKGNFGKGSSENLKIESSEFKLTLNRELLSVLLHYVVNSKKFGQNALLHFISQILLGNSIE